MKTEFSETSVTQHIFTRCYRPYVVELNSNESLESCIHLKYYRSIFFTTPQWTFYKRSPPPNIMYAFTVSQISDILPASRNFLCFTVPVHLKMTKFLFAQHAKLLNFNILLSPRYSLEQFVFRHFHSTFFSQSKT